MHGRKVDFCNVIVVMTCNLGANVITELPAHMKGTEPQVQEWIMDIVRHTLLPELLNRIDETVVFNQLQREGLDTIVEIDIRDIANRLETGQNMTLDVSPIAVDCIAERGYGVPYGARPLKHTLFKVVLNRMSRMLLEGGMIDGNVVRVHTRGEAEIEVKLLGSELGWLCSKMQSSDNNDVVIMRNHKTQARKELDEDT